ncbi:hypothetical protein M758_10G141100 [Ceratodon purpureus]|uniref:Uncharacterized protein n=1 Tax=Ceratodon purpureus TaxID=3225 RepID=A0A8T0GQM1_CERPU|nr:hypothetical protein KC19_10G146100 [Ceratodon purpureus]KAG0604058.1 hypothetical protein M758_10G141100 [Ceratodon purpureus]
MSTGICTSSKASKARCSCGVIAACFSSKASAPALSPLASFHALPHLHSAPATAVNTQASFCRLNQPFVYESDYLCIVNGEIALWMIRKSTLLQDEVGLQRLSFPVVNNDDHNSIISVITSRLLQIK